MSAADAAVANLGLPLAALTTEPDLQLRRLMYETRTALADAETAETIAAAADLAHQRDLRRWTYETSGEDRNRIFRLVGEITQPSVSAVIDHLARWDGIDSLSDEREYTIFITSGGGAVMPGLSLFAFLRRLRNKRPVKTVASGIVASMASVLYQAGTTREIEAGTTLLIHDVSSGSYGDVHSLSDTAEWMKRVNHDLHLFLAERSTLSVEEIADRAKRKDWTMNAEAAVEFGFADKIV